MRERGRPVDKKVAIVASMVVVAGVAGFFLVRKLGQEKRAQRELTATLAVDAGVAVARPAERPAVDRSGGGREAMQRRVEVDDDPDGTLRLEGQVIDADEKPVGGAQVTVTSVPPREVTTEEDGSFFFERLLAREYTLVASKGELAGGPVTARLSAKTEPVILRMKPGAALEVTVLDASTRAPIAGAEVEVRGVSDRAQRADRDGKALFKGLSPGWKSLRARADGYASATRAVSLSAQGASVDKQTIELVAGAPVSGTVVDTRGAPVAGARVTAENVADLFASPDPRRDGVTTDAKGAWRIDALPAGTFRFRATHDKHAPGHTEPIALSGRQAMRDVVIRVEAGGRIEGRVVDKQGAPVAQASVRVAVAGEGFDWDVARSRACDDRGVFVMEGLPRVPLELVASHEGATSSIARVDLAEKPEVVGLVVTLDIDGVIAGVVVTPSGEPIPEAQVNAIADVMSGTFNMSDWRLRGDFTDVTDSGGNFALRGLPPGTYELRASRAGSIDRSAIFMRRGTKASAGDTNVRLVLEEDGAIEGKVRDEAGAPVELYTVRVAAAPPTPFSGPDGAFRLTDVPPGKQTLYVNGPGFMEKIVEEIEVPAGGKVDVGTITVEKGRSVSGRVLDANGAPVAGATVLGGEALIGSGDALELPIGGPPSKKAQSGDDGTYAITGIGDDAIALVADHKDKGRSATVQLPPSRESARVDLTLRAPGSIEGKILRAGKPVGQAIVAAAPTAASREQFIVTSGEDGTYRFERLAPDAYTVSAMIQGGSMFSATRESVRVTVRSGETARLDLELPTGGARVSVRVTQEGATAVFAQVVLMAGEIRAANAAALQEIAAAGIDGTLKVDMITESTPNAMVVFEEVPPGRFTVCAIGLPGNLMDPDVLERIQRDPSSLPMGCVPLVLDPSDREKSVAIRVPKAAAQPVQKGR